MMRRIGSDIDLTAVRYNRGKVMLDVQLPQADNGHIEAEIRGGFLRVTAGIQRIGLLM